MKSILSAIVLCGLVAVVLSQSVATNRPIIGIITLPCDDSDCGSNTEYFPASYVKSVEGGGARVVPIHYTSSAQQITTLLSQLNGVLFTGGGASLDPGSRYFQTIQTVYNYVVQANEAGDFFPLWGTCLGFESICRAASQDPNILSSFDSENYTIPLDFTPAATQSRMFDSDVYPHAPYIMSLLSSQNITMNNHVEGVTPSDFASHQSLSGVFDVLATDVDRAGKQFVSLIEGKELPIYGAQFHAEKPQFEWYPQEVIQHTHAAITANSYFMGFFVDQARMSTHSFSANAEIDFIYRYSPVWTNGEFTQCYFW